MSGELPQQQPTTDPERESRLVDAAWGQVAGLVSPSGPGSRHTKVGAGEAVAPVAIPGYDILGEVHRGGQGVVYLAIQQSTRRKVAVKVLRQGPFAGASDLARFEREVDVLARLRHPGIVAVHDRGVASGCPYLVMDFVAGKPLDAHVADTDMSVRRAMELFKKICEAVHAAHLQGVIHRDLKPANILVDDAGEPRVLDFGLAKLAAGGDATLTSDGQFVGSLPWASPEQAEGLHGATDVRTDVYSLGVLLYAMLTRELPYPRTDSQRRLAEHIIRTAPNRPSSVRRGIGADVETIVLKCLAKEPDRRYQSAGELARDVGNALAGRPIDARRDSTAYVVRKLLRRHWAAAATAGAFVALLAGTALTTTVLYRRAAAAEADAQTRLAQAEQEADKAARVSRVLGELLTVMSPWELAGAQDARMMSLLLDQVRKLAEDELADQPQIRASIDEVLGRGYSSLNKYDLAEEHLTRSLELLRATGGAGGMHEAKVSSYLAGLRFAQGRNDEAESLARGALERQLAEGDSGRDDAAGTLALLAEVRMDAADFAESAALARRSIEMFRGLWGDKSPKLLTPMQTLGVSLRAWGRLGEAEEVLLEALAIAGAGLPAGHPKAADIRMGLGALYTVRAEYGPAEEHLREALRIRRATYDGPHELTAITLSNLSAMLVQTRRHAEAEAAAREALATYAAIGSPDLSHRVSTLVNLAGALNGQRDLEGAEAAYAEALALSRAGYNDARTGTILGNMAALRKARGDLEGAEAWDREALAVRRGALPEGHLEIGHSLNNLGETLMRRGDAASAEPLLREAAAVFRANLGDRHPLMGDRLALLGRCLLRTREDGAEAAEVLGECVGIVEEAEPPESLRLVLARALLAEALIRERRFEEAEGLLLRCDAVVRGAGAPDYAAFLAERFVRLYEGWGKPESAEAWRARIATPKQGG